jgi:hypothetical protein
MCCCFPLAQWLQFVQFFAFLTFFLAYMGVAVYGNDPNWSTAELLAHPQGRAALVLELFLIIMMFGQVRGATTCL